MQRSGLLDEEAAANSDCDGDAGDDLMYYDGSDLDQVWAGRMLATPLTLPKRPTALRSL